MKTKISLAVVGCIVLLAFTKPADPYFDVLKNLDIFASLFREVNALYVDEVDPKALIQTGVQGMLETLDPYTDFIPEEDLEAFNILTTGQYAGIGALISSINNRTVITQPYENFPAHRAGIRVGDEIVSIEGKDVKGKSTSETSALLKGPPHSEVTIVVSRQGKNLTFKMTREQIKISNVVYQGVLENHIGYIKLDDFTPGAAKEVEDAVTSLKQQGATTLILDVRDNPGGLLYEAINMVNLFIPKGREVVATRGKVREWNKSYASLNTPIDLQTPLIVLIDGGSASAAEIVAGSLQDYDRAVLIGQKSFGKGLVQTTRQLSYNTQLKITTARYYIPSGRCIQALDYTHRGKDGSVKKFADSLKSAFQTKNGRTVYDGGGLDPDIAIIRRPYGSALIQLAQSGLIFEYATHYCNQHPDLKSLVNFKLTDSEFQQFADFLNEKKFVYSTDLESQLKTLTESAKQSRQYEELQANLQAIKSKVSGSHTGYMLRFRDEIQPLLEEEIGFHATLHKGRAEASFDHDPELLEAKRILGDLESFQKLLMPR